MRDEEEEIIKTKKNRRKTMKVLLGVRRKHFYYLFHRALTFRH